jgi:hypothetical protein
MINSKRFQLVIQSPKPKTACKSGTFSVDRAGDAIFFTGNGDASDSVIAEMHRTRIEFASASGIMLSGMEPNGCEKNGTQKYRYQEWYLAYPQNEVKDTK